MKESAFEDIKAIKGYVMGVIALAAAVSGFCVTVFGWEAQKVTAVSAVAAIVFISLAYLIQRSENRNQKRLESHIKESQEQSAKVNDSLECLKNFAIENQRSSIRIEMNSYIRNEPYNHDTILAYAEKYFVELDGDWKETDKFLEWVDKENEAGRPVHIPPMLLNNVGAKAAAERK